MEITQRGSHLVIDLYGATPAPSCWSACRRRSSRRTGAVTRRGNDAEPIGIEREQPAWIISTAQQARPKVINEPVRVQLMICPATRW